MFFEYESWIRFFFSWFLPVEVILKSTYILFLARLFLLLVSRPILDFFLFLVDDVQIKLAKPPLSSLLLFFLAKFAIINCLRYFIEGHVWCLIIIFIRIKFRHKFDILYLFAFQQFFVGARTMQVVMRGLLG